MVNLILGSYSHAKLRNGSAADKSVVKAITLRVWQNLRRNDRDTLLETIMLLQIRQRNTQITNSMNLGFMNTDVNVEETQEIHSWASGQVEGAIMPDLKVGRKKGCLNE